MSAKTRLLDSFRRGASFLGNAVGSVSSAFIKSFQANLHRPSVGERAFAKMNGAFQFGTTPSTWSGFSKIEQVMHYRAWVGNVIGIIMALSTKEPPIIAAVRSKNEKIDHDMRMKAWLNGNGSRPEDRHWVTAIEKAKSTSVIRPHEEMEHLDEEHNLVERLKHPNQWDTGADLLQEFIMFLELTGISYLWPVPYKNHPGIAELWVMPSHWVWPQSLGTDRMVDYYEIRPWGPVGQNQPMVFDADELIQIRYPSPLSKVDGCSPLQQADLMVDVDESLRLMRWFQVKAGVNLGTMFKIDAGQDLTQAQIDRAESKMKAKFQGEHGFMNPAILPPGMDVVANQAPSEIAHIQSSDQMRDYVFGMWKLSKTVSGFTEGVNRATFEGSIAQAYYMVVNPRLSKIGEGLTMKLTPRVGPGLRIWWPDMTPADRAVQREEWKLRMEKTPYKPNEFIRWCNQEELPEGDQVVEPQGLVPAGTGNQFAGMSDEALLDAIQNGDSDQTMNDGASEPEKRFSTNGVH